MTKPNYKSQLISKKGRFSPDTNHEIRGFMVKRKKPSEKKMKTLLLVTLRHSIHAKSKVWKPFSRKENGGHMNHKANERYTSITVAISPLCYCWINFFLLFLLWFLFLLFIRMFRSDFDIDFCSFINIYLIFFFYLRKHG